MAKFTEEKHHTVIELSMQSANLMSKDQTSLKYSHFRNTGIFKDNHNILWSEDSVIC